MWRQGARVTWVRDGDQNTKYFHKKANNRRRQSKIKPIKIGTGSIDNQKLIQNHIDNHFKGIMGLEGEHKFKLE